MTTKSAIFQLDKYTLSANTENKYGDKIPPCLTPDLRATTSEKGEFHFTVTKTFSNQHWRIKM